VGVLGFLVDNVEDREKDLDGIRKARGWKMLASVNSDSN
jgi:hypothetical protein